MWEQGCDLGVGEGMWEAEAGVSEIEVVVKGRLRQCPFWREASPTVLSVIEHGYVLPLSHTTNLYEPPLSTEFVCNRTGCIVQVEATPHISSPLSVVWARKGQR